MQNIVVALSRLALAVIVTAFVVQSSLPAGASGAVAMPGFEATERPAPLPEIRFTDGAGTALTLGDFRGRLVLLNIWATWCAPCVREMPSLDRLEARLSGPGFTVIALSQDRSGIDEVARFYTRLGLRNLGLYVDRTARSQVALGVYGLPTTLLIGPDGHEIGRFIGPAEWESAEALALIRHYLETPIESAAAE